MRHVRVSNRFQPIGILNMTEALVPRASEIDLSPVLGRRLTVLGSTGSVGAATLDVVRFVRSRHGEDAFPLQAITANGNVAVLAQQARELRPAVAVIGDASRKEELQ